MYIPNIIDQYDGRSHLGTLNSSNMIPRQTPGGGVRNPDGIRRVPPRTWGTPETLQGSIMRPATMRNRPCQDNHFNIDFRPGKFPGAAFPLTTQYGNFRNQPSGLLSQYYIQQDNPILKPASVFYPGLPSAVPVPS